jgi:hypothetical protein
MNWIIRKSKKITFHTLSDEILKPLSDYIDDYNWILSDLDGNDGLEELLIDYEHDYFILSANEFKKILDSQTQFYWGVIIGVPTSFEIKINENNLPCSEESELIWQVGNLQYPDGEIEIICFDSSYTIVKFNNEGLSNKFKEYFEADAIPLQKFTNKYIK